MRIDPQHYAEFLNAVQVARTQGPVGSSPRDWAANVIEAADERNLIDSLNPVPLDRHQVRNFCQNPIHSSAACFCTVMAWGGMRVPNARKAWRQRSNWRERPRSTALTLGHRSSRGI